MRADAAHNDGADHMQLQEQLAEAIGGARTLARLDSLARLVWQGWSAGAVPEDAAQSLAEAVHSRKVEVRGTIVPVGIPAGRQTIFRPRRAQVTPDRARSIERRRRLAFSGPLPPALASRFTTGELAVLRIIGDEVRDHGASGLPVAAIAARAGVGRTTAQRAIKIAAAAGLLTVQERRRQGRVNLTNVVRIVSREWLDWMKKSRPKLSVGIGSGKRDPTDRNIDSPAALRHPGRTAGHPRGAESQGSRQWRPSTRPRR